MPRLGYHLYTRHTALKIWAVVVLVTVVDGLGIYLIGPYFAISFGRVNAEIYLTALFSLSAFINVSWSFVTNFALTPPDIKRKWKPLESDDPAMQRAGLDSCFIGSLAVATLPDVYLLSLKRLAPRFQTELFQHQWTIIGISVLVCVLLTIRYRAMGKILANQ